MSYPDRPSHGSVLHWREGSIAHIRFNRPEALNAINSDMAAAFLHACKTIEADALVRVVWMSAEGRAFMAGGDIAEMAADPAAVADNLIPGMHGGLKILAKINAPVVASVHGAVAGGGLGLVLGGADLIIAAQGTRFSVAYPLIGASCDCSTSWALPRILGQKKSLELALLGNSVDAAQALQLGLCNRVVLAADLDAETRTLVELLASGPTKAYGQMRQLIRASLGNDFANHLDAEAQGFRVCARTKDFKVGVDAFIAKKPAQFKGD
jgi:2-(1,2-epoxy-1,2-dihydrophenyl)acetyl-CoA isomerase